MNKFSIYLVSALVLISCVSAGSRRHHHHHHKNNQLDDLTTEILNFGINFIFERAADNYGVSADNAEVTKINDIDRTNLDGPITLYWFNVDATNNNDARVEARFGVEYNHETEEMIMGKWKYHIHYNSDSNSDENEFEGFLNEEEDINLENAVDEGEFEAEPEGESEIETEADIETGIDEEGTDDNNEDFEEVPEDEIENSPVIQDALQDGAAFIFDRAADRFGVSNSSFEITDVNSVERRAGENITVYRINIDATNNDDARVEARLTIEHDNQSGENTVGPWRYSIRYRIFDNEEGSLEEESVLEFDMNDGLSDIL